MSANLDRVLLFPGQGAFRRHEPALLAARRPRVREVFDEIDRVARSLGADAPGEHALSAQPRDLEQLVAEAPDVLQLVIYGTSISLWTLLHESGRRFDVLAGHSSGEIAALVAGGAFTVAEGAEIVVHRSAALAALPRRAGGMLALACDADRARRIVDVVGNPLVAVAVRNAPRQVVLAGPADALDVAAGVARALAIAATPLTVAYPFHSPMLAGAVADFAARIRHIEPRPLRTLVFSPILGRFHRPDDALGEHVAASLVAPAAFDRALDRLHDAGARSFVECGTAGTLARIVQRCLPDAAVESATAAAGLDDGPADDPAAVAAEGPAASSPPPAPAPLRLAVAPAAAAPATSPERDELFADLVAMYADALEYPPEVFGEDVKLEEDLGIDSVKQTELMARAAEQHGLPAPPPDFRLGDYDTMGKLVDYVWAHRRATEAPPALVTAPAPVTLAVAPVASPGGREALFAELVAMYAQALEYPPEVFSEDVKLEEDLGIDSVKQTELMARAAEQHGLPAPPPDFRLGDYDTMGKLVDYVWAHRGSDEPRAAVRAGDVPTAAVRPA